METIPGGSMPKRQTLSQEQIPDNIFDNELAFYTKFSTHTISVNVVIFCWYVNGNNWLPSYNFSLPNFIYDN